jgi:CubicO group peptidase (beta-lactamase class C family)
MRRKPTRRQMLTGLGGLAVTAGMPAAHAADAPKRAPALEEVVPISGKAGPGMEPFDPAMLKIMDRHGIPGAALAIAKDGKLLLAKGYGWSNVVTGATVKPDTLFGLASLSKPFTAVAALKLVEAGKLGLDDAVFPIIKQIKPPAGVRVDPLLRTVTVRQCLNHTGGWDRMASGDPIYWEPQICRALLAHPPLAPEHFLSFMMSRPLDFKPGTLSRYSNVGYIVLGEVIEQVSGQPYRRFVQEQVMRPMGIQRGVIHANDGKYFDGESHRYLAGTLLGLPPLQSPMLDAAGGWSCSAVDLVRFLTNLDGSRGKSVFAEKTRQLMLAPPPAPLKPRDDGSYVGLGWDNVTEKDKAYSYIKDGSYQGIRTFMKRAATGVNWALVYNASMEFDPQDRHLAASTVADVKSLVDSHEKYHDNDWFKEYP